MVQCLASLPPGPGFLRIVSFKRLLLQAVSFDIKIKLYSNTVEKLAFIEMASVYRLACAVMADILSPFSSEA